MPDINLKFKVDGNDTKSYMADVTKRQKELNDTAMSGFKEQNKAAEEHLRITQKQIQELQRKQKISEEILRVDGSGNSNLRFKNKNLASSETTEETDLQYRLKRIRSTFEAQRARLGRRFLYAQQGFGEPFSEEDYNLKLQKNKEEEARRIAAERVRKPTKTNEESLKEQKEQLREQRLATSLLKDQLATIKSTADANVKAIMSGNMKLSDVIDNAQTDQEKAIARLTKEGVEREEANNKKESGRSAFGEITGSLLAVESLQRLIGSFRALSQTKNGFDLFGEAGNLSGTMMGGGLGALIGSVVPGIGTMIGMGVGSALGGALGSGFGEKEQRKAIARQEFLAARNRLTAITGKEDLDFYNTADVGVSMKSFAEMQADFARRRGYRTGSGQLTANAIYAERGYGVDRSTTASLVDMMRSSKDSNRNISEFIQGVIHKGTGTIFKNGDTTFLNEFLGKFTNLQKELLKTQTNVATGATMDLLTKFNSVGGEFSARDPRSLGLISGVNESLKNPGSDIKKAISFYTLRRMHPDMSSADLIVEMQKGLNSSGYFNGVMDFVSRMSGDKNTRRLNVAGLLGLDNNQKFADDLLKAWEDGKFKGLGSDEELKLIADMRKKAESFTTPMEKNTASIENALLSDHAVQTMADTFSNAIKASLSGAIIEMEDGSVIKVRSNAVINKNITKHLNDEGDVKTASKFLGNGILNGVTKTWVPDK